MYVCICIKILNSYFTLILEILKSEKKIISLRKKKSFSTVNITNHLNKVKLTLEEKKKIKYLSMLKLISKFLFMSF